MSRLQKTAQKSFIITGHLTTLNSLWPHKRLHGESSLITGHLTTLTSLQTARTSLPYNGKPCHAKFALKSQRQHGTRSLAFTVLARKTDRLTLTSALIVQSQQIVTRELLAFQLDLNKWKLVNQSVIKKARLNKFTMIMKFIHDYSLIQR